MPSSFSHAIAGAAAGAVIGRGAVPRRYWWAAALCAVAPDVDWLWTFNSTLPREHMLLHRGIAHSWLAAAVLALAVTATFFRHFDIATARWRIWLGLFLATASHSFFDALSMYGRGIAFLAPFSDVRWKFPWQPLGGSVPSFITVFPQRVAWGIGREFLLIWVPSLIVLWLLRRARASRSTDVT